MKKVFGYYFGVILFCLLISIPLLIPYLHSGYFPTHDGEWAVVRLSDMFREIRDMQIPPRYSGNLNYGWGYPLFNFAYPFPYYLGLIIHLLGVGFVDTIKLIFALTIPVSAFFMYLSSRNFWKNDLAGIVSAVLYLYFPYRLVDLFVRGSIGESVAFAIFPFVLFCLIKLLDKQKNIIYAVLGSVGYSFLIMSHNISAVLFTLSLMVFFLANLVQKKYVLIKPFLFVLIFGYILSAFFWIPALLEKSNIILSKIPIADRDLYFVSIKQLLFANFGYGVPTDKINGFSYQLGWSLLAVILLIIAFYVYTLYKKEKIFPELKIALILLCGSFFLSLFLFSPFKFFWKVPILSEINYPWIMLGQLGLLLSFLGGFLTKFKYTKFLVIISVFGALFIYIPLAKPSEYIDKGDDYYFTNDATTTSSKELMPLWVKSFPNQRPNQKVEVLKGHGNIKNLFFNSKQVSFQLSTPGVSSIRINTIYYPGWKVFDNGKEIPVSYTNIYGVMDINVSNGTHNINAEFSETKLRLMSDLISLGGLAVLLIIVSQSLIFKKSIWI